MPLKKSHHTEEFFLIAERYCVGFKCSGGNQVQPFPGFARVGAVSSYLGNLIVGAIANDPAVGHTGNLAETAVNEVFLSITKSSLTTIPDIIEEAIKAANTAVFEENLNFPEPRYLTLAAIVIFNNRLFVGNVGDNRVYWVQENGRLLQITQDHTEGNLSEGPVHFAVADRLAHVIGRKPNVGVDIGFYLDPVSPDRKQAFRLGEAGLGLKDGETVFLCNKELVGHNNEGMRFITDSELVDAVQSEFAPAAAVKMLGYAEGRKAQDNLSVIVIQRLTDVKIADMAHSKKALRAKRLKKRVLISGTLLILLVSLVFLLAQLLQSLNSLSLARNATEVLLQITVTPNPTFTPTAQIEKGKVQVERFWGEENPSYQASGSGGVLNWGQEIFDGTIIRSADGSVKLITGDSEEKAGEAYLLPKSEINAVIGNVIRFDLLRGAVLIHPGGGLGFIGLPDFGGALVRVMGSRMAVKILNETQVGIYCYEGECGFQSPAQPDTWQTIDVGQARIYDSLLGELYPSSSLIYEDLLITNNDCNQCIVDLIPTPTPKPTENPELVPTTVVEEEEEAPEKPKPPLEPTLTQTPTKCKHRWKCD